MVKINRAWYPLLSEQMRNSIKSKYLIFKSTFERLLLTAQSFPVYSNKVTFIYHPKDFYEILLDKTSYARSRILLSSLYLGTGNLERNLIQKIETNLKNNKNLKVNILLDYTRGTRGCLCSKSILGPLKTQFKNNFFLSMYHSPNLRGLIKKIAPSRWNELLGLQHMKIYIFDSSVIISGANLSNDYFTNRQDRYILIEDKQLSNFFERLITTVQKFSLNMNENCEMVYLYDICPYKGDKHNFVRNAQRHIYNLFNKVIEEQNVGKNNNEHKDTWVFPLIEMGQLGIHHDSYI